MARITAGLTTSHVPAIGTAIDRGQIDEPYWKPMFDGFDWTRRWAAAETPDVVILVYNDHASAFDMRAMPTFALGCAESFEPADEGFGPRPIPTVQGAPELAAHLAESLVRDEYDLTLLYELPVDHGFSVPVSLVYGTPKPPPAWPTTFIPLAVNVIQYPYPSAHRCFTLGQAVRRAVESFPEDLNVQVWGTGGLSHQIEGARAGLINPEWDNRFMDDLIDNPDKVAAIDTFEYIREAGSEGMEMIMWLVMRGAMGDKADVLHRFYHVSASHTAVGHLVVKPVP